MHFKVGDKAVINGELYTVVRDTDAMNWAIFQHDFSEDKFELYCGRLVHLVEPMDTAPKDGSKIYLVSQGEAHLAYWDRNPDLEWASIYRNKFCQQIFLNPDGWAPAHPSELPE